MTEENNMTKEAQTLQSEAVNVKSDKKSSNKLEVVVKFSLKEKVDFTSWQIPHYSDVKLSKKVNFVNGNDPLVIDRYMSLTDFCKFAVKPSSKYNEYSYFTYYIVSSDEKYITLDLFNCVKKNETGEYQDSSALYQEILKLAGF